MRLPYFIFDNPDRKIFTCARCEREFDEIHYVRQKYTYRLMCIYCAHEVANGYHDLRLINALEAIPDAFI